jgi:hypothetical protein
MPGLLLRLLAVFLALAVADVAPAAAAKTGGKRGASETARREVEWVKRNAMVFYVARGDADACGSGCDTWIAAEGAFDRESAARLRKFLARAERRKLPVFFYSGGGVTAQAMEIGRLLRYYRMAAGVGVTTPKSCDTAHPEACKALKRSGRTLIAELREARAFCASACVYALIGAPRRHIGAGALVGVHASKVLKIYADGRVREGGAGQLNRENARLREYIESMGVDRTLLDLANGTSHDRLHILTREEITRLHIEQVAAADETGKEGHSLGVWLNDAARVVKAIGPAGAPEGTKSSSRPQQEAASPTPADAAATVRESGWTIDHAAARPVRLSKHVTEMLKEGGRELRSMHIYLTCLSKELVRVVYNREGDRQEAAVDARVVLASGGHELVLQRDGEAPREGAHAPSASLTARAPADFFTAAAERPALEMSVGQDGVMRDTPSQNGGDDAQAGHQAAPGRPAPARSMRLSTAGLSEALRELRRSCGEPAPTAAD